MFDVNTHIKRKVINEYRGSEQKETVYLDDGKKYMIKRPDPTREISKLDELSYINNVYSEYIGCHIAKMLGFPVQNTILGEYTVTSGKQKIVCLCEDVREQNETMHEFDTIALSTDVSNNTATFEDVESVISHISELLNLTPNQKEELQNFYYDLFVLDALIGNTDRHNGNVAILTNSDDTFSRISPVYDCGSSMLPLISDSQLDNLTTKNMILSVCSAIHDSDGKRIQYKEYLEQITNPKVDNALKRIFPKINMNKICDFVRQTDYISDKRKAFYCDFLQTRYERVLIPAIERIFFHISADTIG